MFLEHRQRHPREKWYSLDTPHVRLKTLVDKLFLVVVLLEASTVFIAKWTNGNQVSAANEIGTKLDLWPQRMAHLNVAQMKIMASKELITRTNVPPEIGN